MKSNCMFQEHNVSYDIKNAQYFHMAPDNIYVEHLVVLQSATGGQCRQRFRHINTLTRQSSGRHSTFIKALCAK